jgi:pyruvate kinase
MANSETRPSKFVPRTRKVRILATLGPASNTPEMIRKLAEAGADAFRVNMSHGTHKDHARLIETIRGLERELDPPTTILADLQGPKLRVAPSWTAARRLGKGPDLRVDRSGADGDSSRPTFPPRKSAKGVEEGTRLLIDDGKIVQRVVSATADRSRRWSRSAAGFQQQGPQRARCGAPARGAHRQGSRGSRLRARPGGGLDRPLLRAASGGCGGSRRLIAGRAALLAKIEKPAAIDRLEGILELADAVMVARGDLGVELPPEAVPMLQKRIVESARRMGRPVVVATQMLESMITSPTPTRAEVSDVATAVYDGADAVMLSAESASGEYPCEAVTIMNRIATSVEADPSHGARVHFTQTLPDPTTADAIAQAVNTMVGTVGAAAIVCFTSSARRRGGCRASGRRCR